MGCRQKWWQSGDEAVWNCFLTRPKYLKRKWKYECIIFWRCLRSSPATYRQLQGFLPAIVSFMSSFQGFLFIAVTSLNLTTVPLKVIWPSWSPRCVKWNPEVTSLGSVMWLPWPCTRWLYCFFFSLCFNERVCIPWGTVGYFSYLGVWIQVFKEKEESWIVWAYFSVSHFMDIVMMYKPVLN